MLILSCETGTIHYNESPSIIPEPREMALTDEQFYLSPDVEIQCDSTLLKEAEWLKSWLQDKLGLTLAMGNAAQSDAGQIIIKLNEALEGPPEAYTLNISSDVVTIEGKTSSGVFRGLQCFRQWFPPEVEAGEVSGRVNLRGAEVKDWPEFTHRGLLFDCCRHFMDTAKVKQYIDLLAYYRMNTLHWHLTEDQGWRIEIEKYPKLTEIGAWRTGEDGEPYGGFYTKKEIREILDYAAERHINVIPEIELPGHSSAAIAAYPHLSCVGDSIEVITEWGVFKEIYCAGNDTTIQFLKDVLDEVVELFPSQYVHIGGDEAPKFRWEQCSKCQRRIQQMGLHDEHELQSWFIDEIGAHLRSHDKMLIGWDEIHEGGLPEGAVVQSWRSMDGGLEAARLGHYAVMSPTSHCYFDYGLDATDVEEVYSFNPYPEGIADEEKKYILGGEGNMWTERAPQDLVDSKVFPRLIALSEVLWTSPEPENFPAFRERLADHYANLSALNIDFGFETVPIEVVTTPESDHISMQIIERVEDISVAIHGDREIFPDSTNSIQIKEDLHLSFEVESRGKKYPSPIEVSVAYHQGINATSGLLHSYSHWYTGGGDGALMDGRLGTLDFRDGCWQATQGEDMGVVYDLGVATDITSLQTNFYQYNNAWIFLPTQVLFDFSMDGKTWSNEQLVSHDVPLKEKAQLIHEFKLDVENTKAQFVRMRAINVGVNPEWHDSPGQDAWLFCDEVIVR